MTRHTCPICKGKGSTATSKVAGHGIINIHVPCALCEGDGCLPSNLAAMALRYKRKAAMMTTEIRQLRRIIDSHHSGKG